MLPTAQAKDEELDKKQRAVLEAAIKKAVADAKAARKREKEARRKQVSLLNPRTVAARPLYCL